MIKAVLWDFGGVFSTSPFEAFNRYEREIGLPADFIRTLNATNHHDNAWAKLERNDVPIDQFCTLYEAEAEAAGHPLDAHKVLECLYGDMRPEIIEAHRIIHERGVPQALLTNNFVSFAESPANPVRDDIFSRFDVIIESSKVGVRKPEPAFYRMACEQLAIEPSEAVFLDDIGVNLKPAREMGMTTIKVVDPSDALDELEGAVGFSVRR